MVAPFFRKVHLDLLGTASKETSAPTWAPGSVDQARNGVFLAVSTLVGALKRIRRALDCDQAKDCVAAIEQLAQTAHDVSPFLRSAGWWLAPKPVKFADSSAPSMAFAVGYVARKTMFALKNARDFFPNEDKQWSRLAPVLKRIVPTLEQLNEVIPALQTELSREPVAVNVAPRLEHCDVLEVAKSLPAGWGIEKDLTEEPAKVGSGADDPRSPIKVPSEKAMQAWRLRDLTGWPQAEIAEALRTNQGQVSRWIKQVKEYLEAGNVLPEIGTAEKPKPLDPAVIDMGGRQDGRTPRQRNKRSDA